MRTFDYHRKPPDRRPWLTRAEWVIVSIGAGVLTAILTGAAYYVFLRGPFIPF